jgi:hypothetical protein
MIRTFLSLFLVASTTLAQPEPNSDTPPETPTDATEPAPTLSLRDLLIVPTDAPREPIAIGRKHALIVGVGEGLFDGVAQNPLPACRFDAAAMRRVLTDLGFECTTLIDHPETPPVDPFASVAAPEGYPDVDNVHNALAAIVAAAGPDDTILVYMSSHGGMIDDEAKVILTNGTISVRHIKESLGKSQAIARVVMLDCCRVEGSFRPEVSEIRDVHTISACAPDEESQVGVNGLSVFTETFVDAVSDCRADRVRDGVVELDEVIAYITTEVPDRAMRQRGANQHPTRTVVDPKAVNPVLGICDPALALESAISAATTAFAGPRVTVTRHDWIYSSLLLSKVTRGMTFDTMIESMGRRPDEGADPDASGFAEIFYHDEPNPGDAMLVVFEGGLVTQVSTVFGAMCAEGYDPKASRDAVIRLMDGGGLTELDAALTGKSTSEIIELIGCPTASLVAQDGTGDGTLRYLDVPRPTQMLVVLISQGRATGTEIRIFE